MGASNATHTSTRAHARARESNPLAERQTTKRNRDPFIPVTLVAQHTHRLHACTPHACRIATRNRHYFPGQSQEARRATSEAGAEMLML